ncbi:antirestriction protein ArdA [Tetragenococcus halophilus]|uniref:antirestriction protein ArdA n=1 Tax=Tetragenococcus halophilus TaxID=51669 RepID=UPI00209BA781|nr:antirestriction protein ArdA [Tetragenococcus halophilus]MCO8288901.1 antirestriction protein ArdA [Tetragenococcus halophilus]
MDKTIAVYVTNLSQFEYDGLIIGGWFQLPVSEEEVREKLQMEIGDRYEIEDWEAPFSLTKDGSIHDLNVLAVKVEEIQQEDMLPYLEELVGLGIFPSVEEGVDQLYLLTHSKEKPANLENAFELSDGTYFII